MKYPRRRNLVPSIVEAVDKGLPRVQELERISTRINSFKT